MNQCSVRSTLEKAIFLAETTMDNYKIAINHLGTFYVKRNSVLLETNDGELKKITRENLDKHIQELVL